MGGSGFLEVTRWCFRNLGLKPTTVSERVGTLYAVAQHTMSPFTTAAIPQELLRDALLTLEQLTTSISVLALHASHRQAHSSFSREPDLIQKTQQLSCEAGEHLNCLMSKHA